MSFGQEIKDFVEGYKAGSDIISKRLDQDIKRQELESKRNPTNEDVDPMHSPIGDNSGAIPDSPQDTYEYSDINIESDPDAAKVLGFVRHNEAGQNPYNKLVGGKVGDLTNMTVGDVLKYQQGMLAQGHETTALGAYQFIHSTLSEAVDKTNIPLNAKFDQATQDKLGYYLLQKAGWHDYKAGKISKDKMMDNLAGVWAALPLANGKSAYAGVGSNAATTSRQQFASALDPVTADAGQQTAQSGAVPEPGQQQPQQASAATGFIDPETAKAMDPKMVKVVERAARDNPNLFGVNPLTKTIRTPEEQADYVDKGWSKTKNSKHLAGVGKAMDLVPINPKTGKPDPNYTEGYSKVHDAMMKAAQDEGVTDLEWGGDWKTFKDMPHYEVSQLQQPAIPDPYQQEEEQPVMWGASGGVIPEPQYFQDGGATEPVTGNPSAVNGVDRYNQGRDYTQRIQPRAAAPATPAAAAPKPAVTSTIGADGLTPSQRAYKDAMAKSAASRASAAAAKAAAAEQARQAEQARLDRESAARIAATQNQRQSNANLSYMRNINDSHHSQGFGMGSSGGWGQRSGGGSSGGWRAEGGMVTHDFAEGGRVPADAYDPEYWVDSKRAMTDPMGVTSLPTDRINPNQPVIENTPRAAPTAIPPDEEDVPQAPGSRTARLQDMTSGPRNPPDAPVAPQQGPGVEAMQPTAPEMRRRDNAPGPQPLPTIARDQNDPKPALPEHPHTPTPTRGPPSGGLAGQERAIPEETDTAETSSIPPDSGKDESLGRSSGRKPSPKLLKDVSQALHGGVTYLTKHFDLGQDGAVDTPEGQQARQDGARRFAEGEGTLTPDEVNALDDKVDPGRQMTEGDRQMVRLAKTVQWYLQRGRKEDAAAAAAGLMQYGAQRTQQYGSLAAAAYRKYLNTHNPEDLDKTTKILQQAYSFIPNGGDYGVTINPETHELNVSHTDDQGRVVNEPVDPGALPGIIKSVQDKSAYWNQIQLLADPEGVHQRDRDARSSTEWDRQHAITEGEEIAKEGRTETRKLAEEKRAAEAKTAEEKRALDAKLEEEKRKEAADRRKSVFDAAIEKAKGDTKNPNYDKIDPAWSEAQDAYNNKAEPDVLNEKVSRLIDTLPQTADRQKLLQGLLPDMDFSTFKYVPATATAMLGDTPPANYPNKQPGDKVAKGKDKSGQEVWVLTRADGTNAILRGK